MRIIPRDSTDSMEGEYRSSETLCALAPPHNRIVPYDLQDAESSIQLILKIPKSIISDASPGNRFSDPTVIGQGAFGLVFSCEDREHEGNRVAVKILRPSRRHDRLARERFQGEARVTVELRHPNILRVFGYGEIDQIPYMTAELAEVGSIATHLQDSPNAITPRQAAWIVCRIAQAVEDAHENLILHRDIKPGNILLRTESPERSEGLGVWPLLTDFGLAKNLDAQAASPLTFEGQVLGTLAYMSPEQVRGLPLKTQSDLFSMGVILHELVYGQHPFRGEDDFQTRSNIVHSAPSIPPARSPRVPASLCAIISKCLKKNPEDRYLHASDLAQDLDNFLNAKPISVSPPSTWQSLVSWVVAHPLASTCLTTIACCALASILILSREWQVQRELARESQTIAEDHAKISKLFLDSMRVTNSGINDSILAGQRVIPTDLLDTLDHQIPLLEEALALAPEDHLLIRQLEIMYHYKSLCYGFDFKPTEIGSFLPQYSSAVDARHKSLDYLELLIKRFPDEQKLRIAQINGQFFMSVLYESGGNFIRRSDWMDRAISNADAFLATYPNQLDVLETANILHIKRCEMIASQQPERAARELGELIENNRRILANDPSRTSLLTYLVLALSQRSRLLLELNRDSESFVDFSELETLLEENPFNLTNQWTLIDYGMASCVDYCEALATKKYFSRILSITERWHQRTLTERLPDYIVIHHQRCPGPEFGKLMPIYYRWLALSELDPQSHQLRPLQEDLCTALLRCRARSETDLQRFVDRIVDRDRHDALQHFLDEITVESDVEPNE